MSPQEILSVIRADAWMMDKLRIAEGLGLRDWAIGAGFVRNRIWNHLSNIERKEVDTNDIDLVYFDPNGNDQNADEALSKQLSGATGCKWEVVNEAYAHAWNNLPPYLSTEDAISKWPETVTAIGVALRNGELVLIAPHGIEDLIHFIIRPTPLFADREAYIKERAAKKAWVEKWPRLRFKSF